MSAKSFPKRLLLGQGELLQEFTYHYVPDHASLVILRELLTNALPHAPKDYPALDMVVALIEMCKKGMELNIQEGHS